MTAYRGFSKKYRPKTFSEVFAQDSTVQTLKSALRLCRVGQAYLFSGAHGTGKTTLARLFAKAINCHTLSEDQEPCNQCRSCTEIISGHSLDVLEIDGASNRGIDDIRNLNETVNYVPSLGKYKIYIIDEVHMLTREAFNALLKTLEAPPAHVIFFFATTEPHKIPPTAVSRCQQFELRRISSEKILLKLEYILRDSARQADRDALKLIADYAKGSLRDAESLLDKILCYEEEKVTLSAVSEVLGPIPQDLFFQLDKAANNYDLLFAFQLSEQIFNRGGHYEYFLERLAEHFRNILLLKLEKPCGPSLEIEEIEKEKYLQSKTIYTEEQCLEILDLLHLELGQLPKSPFKRIDLEILILQIIRCMKKISLGSLVDQLTHLKASAQLKEAPLQIEKPPDIPPVTAAPSPPQKEGIDDMIQKKIQHEKLMRFASVELKGSLNTT